MRDPAREHKVAACRVREDVKHAQPLERKLLRFAFAVAVVASAKRSMRGGQRARASEREKERDDAKAGESSSGLRTEAR